MLIGEPHWTRLQARLEGLQAWRSSRLSGTRFLALASILAWAAWVASDRTYGQSLAMLGIAYSLIAQFRLWDDLVDRERDRELHPERVLCAASDTTPFVAAVWGLGAVNGIALYALNDWVSLSGLFGLNGALGLWYARGASRSLIHDHVLLLKYPVFVMLLASPASNPGLLVSTSVVVYAALCAFELLDRSAGDWRQRCVLALHCVVLTVAAFEVRTEWLGGTIAVFLTLLLAIVWWCHGRARPLRGGQYLPFAAVAIILFQLSLGSLA